MDRQGVSACNLGAMGRCTHGAGIVSRIAQKPKLHFIHAEKEQHSEQHYALGDVHMARLALSLLPSEAYVCHFPPPFMPALCSMA